jgi:hypothetical protein
MLSLRHLLLGAGIAMFVVAAGVLTCDAYRLLADQRGRWNFDPETGTPGPAQVAGWRTPVALVMLAWAPLLVLAGMV